MEDIEFINQMKEKMQGVEGFDAEEFEKTYLGQVSGLKNKTSELLGTLTETKKKMKTIEERFSGIDMEEYNTLKEELEIIKQEKDEEIEKKARETNNYSALVEREKNSHEKTKKKLQEEIENISQKLDMTTNKYHNKLKDLDLTRELKKANVGDKYIQFVKSTFLGKSVVELDDAGNELTYIKNGDSAIPLSEFISSWAEEDEAKAVIVPPAMSGGGASGSSTTSVSRKQRLLDQIVEAQKTGNGALSMQLKSELEKLQ